MLKSYKIYSHSVKRIDKERNGDYCIFKENDKYLILAVADGVSNQPCDYLASQTACESLVSAFMESNKKLVLKERLKTSIEKANEAVLKVKGDCKGMMCTLSVVVWQTGENKFYYANVGDSRIYLFRNNDLEQITTDDFRYIQTREVIEYVVRTVRRKALTKTIGQTGLVFDIHEGELKRGEGLLLATDGLYEARPYRFKDDVVQMFLKKDLKSSFHDLVKKHAAYRGDDLTAIVLKIY